MAIRKLLEINGIAVTVTRPDLTPEERTRRETEVKQALKYYNEKRCETTYHSNAGQRLANVPIPP